MPGFLDLPPELRNAIYFYTQSLVPTQHALPWTPLGIAYRQVADGGNEVEDGKILGRYNPAPPSVMAEFPRGGHDIRHIAFPTQPSITQVNRQIRAETLPIFYGANRFEILDWYGPRISGIKTTFLTLLLRWLRAIEAHIPLFKELTIDGAPGFMAQRPDEIVAALMDLGLPFKEGALIVRRWDALACLIAALKRCRP